MSDLLPCPFCGGTPTVRTYQDESLWSRNIVTKTQVSCHECDISFESEPGYEFEAPEAWNRRPLAYEAAKPAGRGELVGWAYEFHEFGNVWKRHIILNRPDGGANPPTKHHGSEVRNVRAVYATPPAPATVESAARTLYHAFKDADALPRDVFNAARGGYFFTALRLLFEPAALAAPATDASEGR